MIQSKAELKEYLEQDKIALNRNRKRPNATDVIWKYEILLRKCEYYNNCAKNPIVKFIGGGLPDIVGPL